MTKLVYIAHKVSGNIEENIEDILNICRDIHLSEEDVTPFAPYIVCLQYLDDNVSEERELGILADKLFFERDMIDETWLSGPNISFGMEQEIKLSLQYGIPIRCYNPDLKDELDKIISNYFSDNDINL